MRRQTKAWIGAAAVLALVAAACGGDDEGGGDAFRIAVVAPSASNDLAFTQSIVDAVNAIQDERGEDEIEIAITDGTFIVEDAAAAIRDYANDGYDLVIGHGSQYGASVEQIAPDFPDTAFAWGTAADTFELDNVYAYTVASDQGGYVQGVMAAMLTDSGTIGVVGPIEVGDAALYVDGFIAGVNATDSSVSATANYTGSFSDVALASEAAQAFVANGADVLTGTAQMVVGAVTVAQDNDVLWFGTQSNQTSLAPDLVVSSQVYHWEVVLDEIVDKVQDGQLGGESFLITLANEGIEIEFNDGFDLPDDVRDAAEETIDGLADGSLSTGL